MKPEAQSFAVKRAEVEFHNFASLGEPERAIATYAAENARRGAILRAHLEWAGPLSPFLEIGGNAGHSSYMLANEFGANGFVSDISCDALRYGRALMDVWHLDRAPFRVAADALNLPFQDNSLQLVTAFQMLSQFQDIEAVFLEVRRVLRPGGVFFFAEEPLRRRLSLRLYRCPYWETMKPWERKLADWGLLGYLVKDVIGAHQEESFGIRQNHRMYLEDWHRLILKHFEDPQYQMFVPERGWGERGMKSLLKKVDRFGSDWVPARLLGGTLAAMARKPGQAGASALPPVERNFTAYLRCPDCHAGLRLDGDALVCAACGYAAPDEGGVHNLLPAAEKRELYPGIRGDVIDFTLDGHEKQLLEGFSDLEGVYGNRYRWMGPRGVARLERVTSGPQRLRIRGHAHERWLAAGTPRVTAKVNGAVAGDWTLDRTGLFILEAKLPDASAYTVELLASPTFDAPPDDRVFTANISLIRLVPEETAGD